MLDKVCLYECNYAYDGIVQRYCLTMIKFVIQITLQWNINTIITRLMHALNDSTNCSL